MKQLHSHFSSQTHPPPPQRKHSRSPLLEKLIYVFNIIFNTYNNIFYFRSSIYNNS